MCYVCRRYKSKLVISSWQWWLLVLLVIDCWWCRIYKHVKHECLCSKGFVDLWGHQELVCQGPCRRFLRSPEVPPVFLPHTVQRDPRIEWIHKFAWQKNNHWYLVHRTLSFPIRSPWPSNNSRYSCSAAICNKRVQEWLWIKRFIDKKLSIHSDFSDFSWSKVYKNRYT